MMRALRGKVLIAPISPDLERIDGTTGLIARALPSGLVVPGSTKPNRDTVGVGIRRDTGEKVLYNRYAACEINEFLCCARERDVLAVEDGLRGWVFRPGYTVVVPLSAAQEMSPGGIIYTERHQWFMEEGLSIDDDRPIEGGVGLVVNTGDEERPADWWALFLYRNAIYLTVRVGYGAQEAVVLLDDGETFLAQLDEDTVLRHYEDEAHALAERYRTNRRADPVT